MTPLSITARRRLLFVATTLIVGVVRHRLQYSHYPWDAGVWSVVNAWLSAVLGVGMVIFLVYMVMGAYLRPWLHPQVPKIPTQVEMREATESVCAVALVVSVFIWFLVYGWPIIRPMMADDD
jgi:hypothetical protein